MSRSDNASRRLGPWAPWGAGLAGFLLSLPAHLSFMAFFGGDLGGSLASALLANRGAAPQVDFSFPYGSLTLGIQQLAAAAAPGHEAWAFAGLELVCTLVFAAAAAAAIRGLRLGGASVWLLSAASFAAGMLAWAPVYSLEAAAIAWALTLYARGHPGGALAACVAGFLIKPSMSALLGGMLAAACLVEGRGWRGARRAWRAPALAAALLAAPLAADFGWGPFLRMLTPIAGARDYHKLGYSFFSRTYNPLLIPGENWHYFLGTPPAAWLLATGLLAALLVAGGRGGARETRRIAVGWICLAGTIAFIAGFYAHLLSYQYYLTLPLLGLALLPRLEGARRGLAYGVAGLTLLGNFSGARGDWMAWRDSRPTAASAGLWATPAQAEQWERLARAYPPSAPPLFLQLGSPEAIFPAYGPPWHGDMGEGEATPGELEELDRRAARQPCVAIAAGWWPVHAPEAVAAARRRTPAERGALFDTYGCADEPQPAG